MLLQDNEPAWLKILGRDRRTGFQGSRRGWNFAMVVHSGLPTFDCSIALLGASAVGKTALLRSLFKHEFPERHEPSLDDYYMHTIAIDGVHYNLRIVDTSGTHNFPVMRRFATDLCGAFIIMFSFDKPDSFEEAIRLLDEVIFIKRATQMRRKVPVVLVANKLDVGAEGRDLFAQRSSEEISARAADITAAYTEISVKKGYPVETGIFHPLVKTAKGVTVERKRSKLKGMISSPKRTRRCLEITQSPQEKKRKKTFFRLLSCISTKLNTVWTERPSGRVRLEEGSEKPRGVGIMESHESSSEPSPINLSKAKISLSTWGLTVKYILVLATSNMCTSNHRFYSIFIGNGASMSYA